MNAVLGPADRVVLECVGMQMKPCLPLADGAQGVVKGLSEYECLTYAYHA